MKKTNRKSVKGNFRAGSALILAVVLTTLLAIIGVTFVMSARVDRMATDSVSENKELNYAVESVVTKISQLLAEDVPTDPNQEYYDYPDSYNRWLASLEPYYFGPWQQISDIYGQLDFGIGNWVDDFNDLVGPGNLIPRIIQPDWSVGGVTDTVTLAERDFGGPADADGDGVSDSRWIKLPNMTSSKGKPVFAAIRIIDNCAMININTAFRDPNDAGGEWDGSRLSHINLQGIISPTDKNVNLLDVTTIQELRYGSLYTLATMPLTTTYNNDTQYDDDVAKRLLNPLIISIVPPIEAYAPFDISDELELRNRFFLSTTFIPRRNNTGTGVVTRSSLGWPATFDPQSNPGRGRPFYESGNIPDWYPKATPDLMTGSCNKRHLSTTYSFDRTLRPTADTTGMPTELQTAWAIWEPGMGQNGAPVCVTDYWGGHPDAPNIAQIAAAIWLSLPANPYSFNLTPAGYSWGNLTRTDVACQLAVNLVDYIDTDQDSTPIIADNNGLSTTYYGYEEQNNAYISEIAVAKYDDGVNPFETYYALELYNPGSVDITLAGWQLVVGNTPIAFGAEVVPAGGTLVIVDSAAAGADGFNIPGAATLAGLIFADDDHVVLLDPVGKPLDGIRTGLVSNVPDPGANTTVVYTLPRTNWMLDNKVPVWDTAAINWVDVNDLGVFAPDSGAFPENRARIQVTTRNDGKLPTIGEIFNVLGIGASFDGAEYKSLPEWFDAYRNGADLTDITAGRMDAKHEDFADLMRFLTVFGPFSDSVDNDGNGKSDNPASDGVDNDEDGLIDGGDPDETFANYGEFAELAVAGRININTAPWYVIAQLPWVTNSGGGYELAQEIAAYRNSSVFENIAQLNNVVDPNRLLSIDYYGRDSNDLTVAPDFTPSDGVKDDIEERDIIFSRISNLVTVRSDVFTAYILVRIGADGPQKRVIAIFDRSKVFSANDKPKLVALHPVPDPR